LRREFSERATDGRRAAGGVFVEVEAEFVGAAFAGRFVGAAVEDGLADREFYSGVH
jgi:hypothetical protein